MTERDGPQQEAFDDGARFMVWIERDGVFPSEVAIDNWPAAVPLPERGDFVLFRERMHKVRNRSFAIGPDWGVSVTLEMGPPVDDEEKQRHVSPPGGVTVHMGPQPPTGPTMPGFGPGALTDAFREGIIEGRRRRRF